MDLRQFALTDEGAVMTLRHPKTDEELPLWIRYASRDSRQWRKASLAQTNRNIEVAQKRGKMRLTAEELEEQELERLVAVTLEWSPEMELDGTKLELTPDNARKLYKEFPSFYRQGNDFVAVVGNFLKGGDGI